MCLRGRQAQLVPVPDSRGLGEQVGTDAWEYRYSFRKRRQGKLTTRTAHSLLQTYAAVSVNEAERYCSSTEHQFSSRGPFLVKVFDHKCKLSRHCSYRTERHLEKLASSFQGDTNSTFATLSATTVSRITIPFDTDVGRGTDEKNIVRHEITNVSMTYRPCSREPFLFQSKHLRSCGS